MDDVCELIDEAMAPLRIVVCPRCNGLGEVGLPTLRATCPDCGGGGEIVVNINVITHELLSDPTTRREAVMALINSPEEAARLLKTIGYEHGEIVNALVKQFQISQSEAEALASA